MEDTSRPMLLSPGLPRLPGGLVPQPPAEPPLTHEEFAPRPPPLPTKPLPPEFVAKMVAGRGMEVALEGWRKKSQLAWCIEHLRKEEEAAAAAEAAAARRQAERPARAPGGPAAHAAASAAVSSNSESGDDAGLPADPLHRQHSRASAVFQAAAEAAGGGGRGRGRGRKGGRGKRKAGAEGSVQLATVLNKNSPIFHEGFAAAFKEAREELDKLDVRKQRREKLKEHSKLVSRWSELTVQEHQWYLAHQGQALTGSDAQRFALLASKVAEEQQQYYQDVQQKAAGGASAARYGHCTARQGAQLEQDAADRRQRQVQRLPRLYRLVAPLPVATAPDTAAQAEALMAEALQLLHLGTLRQEGQPPAFTLPATPAPLNSSLRYLPCTVEGGEAGAAGAAAGGSGAAGGSSRGGGAPRVYSKATVPLLAEDPLLPQLAQQARQQAATAGVPWMQDSDVERPPPPPPAADGQPQFCLAASAFAALVSTPMLRRGPAWEIPVTILPADQPAAAAGAELGGSSGGGSGGGSGSGSGTTVCLEKPMLHRIMSMRAKQQRLQKYAVLSLGLQPSPAEAQHAQQAQQQQQQATPGRRRTRGSAAASAGAEGDSGEAAATAAAAAPASGAAAGPGMPPREAAYDCWQLGDCRLLVRSHGRLQLQQQEGQQQQQQQQQQDGGSQQGGRAALQQPGGEQQQQEERQQEQQEAGGQHVVLGLKTEYLPDPDREEHTMEELCAWWLKLLLRPSASTVLAAHVHVPHSRLLSAERLTAGDLEQLIGGAPRMRQLAAAGLAMLQGLLRELGRQPPGRYLLTHVPYEEQCCLFRAVPAEVAEYAQGPLPPLPCSPSTASAGAVYDLHAAHEHSGATDAAAIQFVPPRWRAFMPDIPQIPHTFPPRLSMAKMGGKKAARKRQRKALPFAWGVLGEGGDFDQVQHLGQISRADYLAGLQDELA
ncbi:zinc finger domain containing [Chlorella sorokiniana]|uniref:Zinc finger domain containing n=1 Tax=Chlorella sorokiniana TaxID=3076 RepID=A0A2P6TQ32_CHLSO|nr:zinc finger domain containing [Chlorella sorokiniana]|eukprot:PRW56140.1 zinc finger domain containing [Chlorella sorokiniana]